MTGLELCVLGGNGHAFNDDLASLREGGENLALLALVLAGDHNHRVLGTDLHNSFATSLQNFWCQ